MKTEERPSIPEPARGHDLFVSYSRADRERVVALTQGLAERGKRAWVDLEDIPPSAEWMGEIRAAIEAADGYLVVVSPALAGSKVCAEELEHAREAGKRIVPVLVSATDPESVPKTLAALNWIDATGPDLDPALDRIVQALETDLEHTKGHTRLLVRASEWEHKGEDRSLLLRGSDLQRAEAFLVAAQGKEPAPTPVQARFIQASRQGTSRRQRTLIASVSIALVVALLLSILAVIQRSEAVNQRAVAERNATQSRSRELAASSISQLDADPELSVMLAVQAMKAARTPEALDALRQGLTESRVRATLPDLGAPVLAVSLAPADVAAVAATSDGKARIWDPNSASDPIELLGHSDLIDATAFSPDGSLVVTASFDETARVWTAADGSEVATLRGHEGAVNDAAFSPDGALVVTGGEDGTVRVWDARTGQQVLQLKGHQRPVYDVSFNLDGALIVSASDDDTARIWDAKTGNVLRVLRGHEDGVYTAAFDAGGDRVVTASQDGTAKVWNVATGRLVADLVGHQAPVVTASFAPDGGSIVTASEDQTARVWDPKSGRQLQVLRGHEDQLNSATFSPDGREIVTASQDGTARVWNTADGSPIAVLRGHEGPVLAAAFSSDGAHVVTGGQDGTVHVWEPLSEATLYTGGSSWSSADPETRIVATSNYDGTVHVASTQSQRELWSEDVGAPQTGVAVSPDAKLVVSGGFDGVGHVYDAATGEELGQLRGHGRGYFSADFYGTDHVLTWSEDGTARLWDPRSGEQLGEFDHGGNIWEAHLSRDGTEVFTTGLGDGTVRMWDVATGKQLWSHSGLLGPPSIGAAISPDGTMVGTVSSQAVIWDAATGKKLSVLEDPGSIHGVGFSEDSKTVLSRSDDGGARIWDPRTGELLVEMMGPDAVDGISFSPDGRWVLTGGGSAVRVWDARTGEQAASFSGEGGGAFYGLMADGDRSVVSFSGDGIAIDRCDACGTPQELFDLATARATRSFTSLERMTYLGSRAAPSAVRPKPAGLTDAGARPVPDGALAPGSYTAVGFAPRFSFTLGEGWFVQTFVDHAQPPEVQLGQLVQLQQAGNVSNGLSFLFMDPGRVIDGGKLWDERRSIEPFPDDLPSWFTHHPNFDVLRRGPMSVGGITGSSIDTLGTSIPKGNPWPNCGGCILTITLSTSNMTGPIGDSLTMGGSVGEIDRWIVVRSGGGTFLINAWSASRKDFRAFTPIVNDILESVKIGN